MRTVQDRFRRVRFQPLKALQIRVLSNLHELLTNCVEKGKKRK